MPAILSLRKKGWSEWMGNEGEGRELSICNGWREKWRN